MAGMTRIPCMTPKDSPGDMAAALDAAGCLVVTDLLDAEGRERVRDSLAPSMEAALFANEDKPGDFYPARTRRITALVARSEPVHELILHDTSNALARHHLGDAGHQLHVTAGVEVGPGARAQELHREEDAFPFFECPRPKLILASMWAITDFSAENGGTRLVPGSHRWSGERSAEPDEIVAAEMPAGSALFWLGGTLHGAGANVSQDWRYGLILTYSLPWLRQEENQYLDIPRDMLENLSPPMRVMIGHTMHGALGFHDPSVGG